MKIYFNQHYSSNPYVDYAEAECFGTVYCGAEGLLSIMMLHGGIAGSSTSVEERKTAYHNNMQRCIENRHLCYSSFKLDSFATSNAVLAWRDTLVAAGWDLKNGDTPKLQFIRDMEPADMPPGNADHWNKALQLSAEQRMFPENTEIIVTQTQKLLEPKLAALFANQERFGITIRYQADERALADGNLGEIQQWFLDEQCGRINITKSDDTFELLRFDNEEAALRYIATQSADRWSLYYCQQAKRFDNTLRLLGQPVCGSELGVCEPQVVQLFTLGNGVFEYPLNLNRILAWLNAPIHPLGRSLCQKLAKALASSGGICNIEWNSVIAQHLDACEDAKERKREREKIATFLPLQTTETLETQRIAAFNKALGSWAKRLLSMKEFPYDGIVLEQLRQIDTYCSALLGILQEYRQESVKFIELQRWCQSIVSPKSYTQYEAEAGCRCVITAEGDIHSVADSLVWFCIEDNGAGAYPFDFLTTEECAVLKDSGTYIYDKTQYSRIKREAMVQTLLRTRKLTIIECTKLNGEPLRRHPLMLQLNEAVDGGLASLFITPQLSEESLTDDKSVNNSSDELVLQLEDDVVIHPRHEYNKVESYSSLDLLIQHPFDYVCQYNAALDDVGIPTLDDRDRTMGNVAHRIIEKVFEHGTDKAEQGRRVNEEYDRIFNETVDSIGLLLRQREYAIDLNTIHKQMRGALGQLQKLIIDYSLTVNECEYEFKTLDWLAAGDGVKLASRADMLLTDTNGNKVIFDFKWSKNRKSYEKRIQNNSALQLAIYKHLAEKEFGCSVRTAYILLPGMEFVSGDKFDEYAPVEHDTSVDMMRQAANAYAFRRQQLAERCIERAEGLCLEESEYGAAQAEQNLYPLNAYDGKISENIFADFNKLR
ncbi:MULTISPECIES: PD-(D/E)XK nuclease family protein [unclassified Alistipes]|uniref:PD-(D/E)XK nuclease family protein n=1 Tax=unclassified Alistipes TaxID=2608932 RepID=UPI00258C4DC2|nr:MULTISPECIES: PD-(D/E)XK nuclease family protein [unclassified Alistipes]HUN14949.1 PD-(D/E)XK nuclease family protein [Alistipes sp.]